MSPDSAMMPGCDGHADPGKDGPCPPAWCALCPVLLPVGLVIPDSGGAIIPAPADERGGGLSLRPHPPPPRRLRRA